MEDPATPEEVPMVPLADSGDKQAPPPDKQSVHPRAYFKNARCGTYLFVLGLVTYITVAISMTVYWHNEMDYKSLQDRRDDSKVFSTPLWEEECANNTCVEHYITMIDVVPKTNEFMFLVLSYLAEPHPAVDLVDFSGSLSFGSATVKWTNGTLFPIRNTIKVDIDWGDQNMYPFDNYETLIKAFQYKDKELINLRLYMSFKTTDFNGYALPPPPTSESEDPYTISMTLSAHHPNLFYVYPCGVILVMLMFALLFSHFGWYIGVQGYEPQIHQTHVVLCVSTVFAFPALRRTLPGDPPLGCLFDDLGFYWAMMGCCFALLTIGGRYVIELRQRNKLD